MIRVCHLLDADAGWEQRVGVAQLLDRLSTDGFQQFLGAAGAAGPALSRTLRRPVERFDYRPWLRPLAAPRLMRFLDRHRIDLVHAWGPHAAAAARAAGSRSIVLELFDPVAAVRHAKLIRTLATSEGFAVACSCRIVRRRLAEHGVSPERTAVIRPGIGFSEVNRYRRGGLRHALGVDGEHTLVLIADAPSSECRTVEAFLAAAMINTLSDNVRVVLPGTSHQQTRIAGLADSLPIPPTLARTGPDRAMEELVAASDLLMLAARDDVSTTAVAWAMAAETVVIAPAVYAVAEMISNKVNGLLFKQVPGKSTVTAVATLLQDRDSHARLKEVARGQAYEVFGLRRCVEQHMRLYENIMNGSAPAQEIPDSADTTW